MSNRENHEVDGKVKLNATTIRQFLPGALAVQETPPSPLTHWLLSLLLALFCIALLWACIGEVDIVVTAPGRIVPNGHVKTVQANESGMVESIFVEEGQRVRKGQALVQLDPSYAHADSTNLRAQLLSKELQLMWRREFDRWLKSGRTATTDLSFRPEHSAAARRRTQTLYKQQQAEVIAQISSMQGEISANLAEQRALNAEQAKVRGILAVLLDRVAAYKALFDKQYGARAQYLEILQQQTELELSLPILRARKQQLEEAATVLASKSSSIMVEQRKKNLQIIAGFDTERASLALNLYKAEQRERALLLTAPVDGVILGLQVHTVGGVVTPAQVLMKLVPDNVGIAVEAYIQNKDIGFVHTEQSAEIKVDTFNFTKYGLIDAITTNISSDAIEDKARGWVFKMQLALEQDQLAVENKWVKLSPGMDVTVEINTGKRRLIEFFLSPLLRYKAESVRER